MLSIVKRLDRWRRWATERRNAPTGVVSWPPPDASGKGDGIFVNTAEVWLVPSGVRILPTLIQPGNAILVSDDLGSHGVVVLSVREGLTFAGNVESDSAPLHAGPDT